MSKAALNMWNKSLSIDLKSHICLVLSPGWVQTGSNGVYMIATVSFLTNNSFRLWRITDMGGKNAALTPTESTNNIVDLIGKLSLEHTGRFLNHLGKEVPW